jgi:formate dehydrogenase maturation protein FdhE
MSEGNEQVTGDPIAQMHERRRQVAMYPKMCSQCMMAPSGPAFIIEDQHDKDGSKFMLCSLRCMALWAMARGWNR